MPLSQMTRLKLGRLAIIVIAWQVFAVYNVAFENLFLSNFPGIFDSGVLQDYTLMDSLITALIICLVIGPVVGCMEVFVFEKRLARHRFSRVVLVRSLFYVFVLLCMTILTSLVYNTTSSGESPLSPHVLGEVREFVTSGSLWYVLMPWSVVMFLTLAVVQVSNIFGPGILPRFIAGRYFHPTEEFRVFMFLDVKSSTTLAEKMGNMTYFRFISQFIEDVAAPIYEHNGEIYKYVGDELIISWTRPYANSCIPCFHAVEDVIASLSERYRDTYGHIPAFKAGAHCGPVIVGEIGVLKKEIMYSGDVLNTAARIQAQCNEYDHSLLVSEAVLALHDDTRYQTREFEPLRLRGKLTPTRILGVART